MCSDGFHQRTHSRRHGEGKLRYAEPSRVQDRFEAVPAGGTLPFVWSVAQFPVEESGQSEAIASNLTIMAGLKTPIITVVIGEGGSGGALGIVMGNSVGMLSQGYCGVISSGVQFLSWESTRMMHTKQHSFPRIFRSLPPRRTLCLPAYEVGGWS